MVNINDNNNRSIRRGKFDWVGNLSYDAGLRGSNPRCPL